MSPEFVCLCCVYDEVREERRAPEDVKNEMALFESELLNGKYVQLGGPGLSEYRGDAGSCERDPPMLCPVEAGSRMAATFRISSIFSRKAIYGKRGGNFINPKKEIRRCTPSQT